MSKKRLGGRRPHWPNHGKSCVIFPFYPNHTKAQTCDSDPRNKLGAAILTSYTHSPLIYYLLELPPQLFLSHTLYTLREVYL